jgi:hypothetical protein
MRTWSGRQFPANPWSGNDVALMAVARTAIDQAPQARPDGPPANAGAAAAFHASRAENVVQAYRAVYVSESGARVEVLAVTFDDPALVRSEPVSALTNPPRGMRSRFARDTSVVVVSAPKPDACARAVETHVRSQM